MEPFDNLEYFKYIFPVVPYQLQSARPVYHQPHCDVIVPVRQSSFYELHENIPYSELEKPKNKKRNRYSRYSVYTRYARYRILQKKK